MKSLSRGPFQALRRRRPVLVILVVVIILCSIVFFSSFAKKEHAAEQPRQGGAVPVTVAKVNKETVPLQLTAIGKVEPFSTVSVVSQVSGQLIKVHFQQGQYVKKGDPLFTIDPRPSEADLAQALANQSKAAQQQRQAEATLARDQAQARTAREQEKRYATLLAQGVVSQQQYDDIRTNAESLEAVVKADQASIATEREAVSAAKAATDAVKLQVGYTAIKSPIDGQTGSLMINQGNVIKANDTNPLVVINQISPIFVSFSLPEAQLAMIKQYSAKGALQVTATFPNSDQAGEQGKLSFIDNAVDAATGTIKFKGTFPNSGQHLWPGQFVNVVLNLTTQVDAITVPSAAVQTGQQGRYVFVVKPDQTVELRSVTMDRISGDKTIISSGLAEGETVVTDGQLKLRPGTKIKNTEAQNSAKPGKPGNESANKQEGKQ